MRTIRPGRAAFAVLAVLATAGLLAACSESESSSGGGASTTAPGAAGSVQAKAGDGTTVISRFEGAEWFDGTVPAPSAADTSQPPIKVGFMNVDSGPIGAMPELHAATDAAVAFINKELGGVGGRPIEVVPCLLSNPLSADEAQACARQFVAADVLAVLGGIGLSNGAALSVLQENGIPFVGGIPVNSPEMTSPISFQFSGGSPGAFVAFAQDAVQRVKAKQLAILYAEYPSIKEAAIGYGAGVAQALGAQVTEVPFAMASQDYVAPVQKAVEAKPDAILVGAADMACAPIMQALADLRSTATVYMVGSCADVKQIDKVGVDKVTGFLFNVENRIDQTASTSADTEIYTLVIEKYAPGTTPRSAATVGFRGVMNLWAVLSDIGPQATRTQVIDSFRAARDRPSFDGHPYTCDGKQIPALPSLCSPQEVIAELKGRGDFVEASDGWIDVPAIVAATGVPTPTG
ncbi:MAG: ABC transporter substrate-binding protein [Microthrixaceae bacterium]